jgi:hypothetical protein
MPLQIVADLDQNRRASIPEKEFRRHAYDGVRVARTKNRVDLFRKQKLEERPDHPDRFPPVSWKRFSEEAILKVGSVTDTCSPASAEDNDWVMPRGSPMLSKAQRHTLYPAWFEAVDRNGNAHPG